MKKIVKEHIAVCIDLIGFRAALESDKDDEKIINMLQYFKSCEQPEKKELGSDGGTHMGTFTPKITYETDYIKISLSENDIQPFDRSHLIFEIINTVSRIMVSALMHDFLARGGVMYGKVYSLNEWDFDLAFADAFKLEAIAELPMVILHEQLVVDHARVQQLEFLVKTKINGKYFFWIDFIKFAFTSNAYKDEDIKELINHVNLLIAKNIIKPELSEKERVKWLWFKDYFERSVSKYERLKMQKKENEERVKDFYNF